MGVHISRDDESLCAKARPRSASFRATATRAVEDGKATSLVQSPVGSSILESVIEEITPCGWYTSSGDPYGFPLRCSYQAHTRDLLRVFDFWTVFSPISSAKESMALVELQTQRAEGLSMALEDIEWSC